MSNERTRVEKRRRGWFNAALLGVVLVSVPGCGGAQRGRDDSESAPTTLDKKAADPGVGVESGLGGDPAPTDAIEAYERYSEHGFPHDVELLGWTAVRSSRGVDMVQFVTETDPERAAELAALEGEVTPGTVWGTYRGSTDARIDEALSREPVQSFTKFEQIVGRSYTAVLGEADVVTVVLKASMI